MKYLLLIAIVSLLGCREKKRSTKILVPSDMVKVLFIGTDSFEWRKRGEEWNDGRKDGLYWDSLKKSVEQKLLVKNNE